MYTHTRNIHTNAPHTHKRNNIHNNVNPVLLSLLVFPLELVHTTEQTHIPVKEKKEAVEGEQEEKKVGG
jgi:hypothetical protein